jgi:hypothetical protein
MNTTTINITVTLSSSPSSSPSSSSPSTPSSSSWSLFVVCSVDQQHLVQLEETAKAAGKGKFAPDASSHVRDIKWVIENPRHFVDSHHNKPIEGMYYI